MDGPKPPCTMSTTCGLRVPAAASVEASAFSRTNKPTVLPAFAGTVETCVTKKSLETIGSSAIPIPQRLPARPSRYRLLRRERPHFRLRLRVVQIAQLLPGAARDLRRLALRLEAGKVRPVPPRERAAQ